MMDLVETVAQMAESCGVTGVATEEWASRVLQSLNTDPWNLRAEEVALQECTLGVEVRRTWSEQEMVRSFGGQVSPGTPDGMFESWDGDLTCVQVVRVPLVPNSDSSCMQLTLAQTILTKVVKSQRWLQFAHTGPRNFIIFCWLPFCIPDDVEDHAEILMERIRALDRRFSLRLRTPAEPGALFPSQFARNNDTRRKLRSFTESDVSTYQGSEPDNDDDDDFFDWDLWNNCGISEECEEPPGVDSSPAAASCAEGDDANEFEYEWNLTWDETG